MSPATATMITVWVGVIMAIIVLLVAGDTKSPDRRAASADRCIVIYSMGDTK